ncbi:unnamed protein product, partial [Heterosigma akashiwo]
TTLQSQSDSDFVKVPLEVSMPIPGVGYHAKVGPFGWGVIVSIDGTGTAAIELDWFLAGETAALCYSPIAGIEEFSSAAVGSHVETPYGQGILVDFQPSTACHVVRLWAPRRHPGTAKAFLRGSDVSPLSFGDHQTNVGAAIARGFPCVTPFGRGRVLQQRRCRTHPERVETVEVALPFGTGCLAPRPPRLPLPPAVAPAPRVRRPSP